MIYKLYGNSLCDALVNGAQFIIFSFDGKYALVRSKSSIANSLETYSESDLPMLYKDPLYTQPCKDC